MGINRNIFNKNSPNHRVFFFLLLSIATAATVFLLKDYLTLIVMALLYSVLVRPLYEVFSKKWSWSKSAASGMTILITFITIVFPLIMIGSIVVQEALLFRNAVVEAVDPSEITIENGLNTVNTFLGSIPGVTIEVQETDIANYVRSIARPTGTFFANQIINIGTSSAVFIAHLFIFLVLVFFLLPALPNLKKYLLKLSPMPDQIDQLYVSRIISMTHAMIKGTFFVAVIQGVLAGLLLLVMGVPYVLILTIVMTLLAIIPVLSTVLVTYPIAIYFLLSGDITKGIIILLVQTLFISVIDNILRPVFASGEGHMHPGILLLAILGGLQVFGFAGIIFGPVIVIFFTTSLEIYQKYYK